MADIQGMLKDPDFKALPPEEMRKVMVKVDQDFAGLAGSEQDKILAKFSGKPSLAIPGRDITKYSPDLIEKMRDTSLNLLPMLGATAATLTGPAGVIPGAMMATAGGMGGRLLQNLLRPEAPGAPQTPTERFTDPLTEGAKMGAWETGGGLLGMILKRAGSAAKFAADPAAQALQKFSEANNLPFSPSTIFPSKTASAVESAVNLFPTGKAVTTAYQNKLSDWLLKSRGQVISDLTGIGTEGTGKRLIEATGDVKTGLAKGVKEAYEDIIPTINNAGSGELRVYDGKIFSASKLQQERAALAERITAAEQGGGMKPDVTAISKEMNKAGVPTNEWMQLKGEGQASFEGKLMANYRKRMGSDPPMVPGPENKNLPDMLKRAATIDETLDKSTTISMIPMTETKALVDSLWHTGKTGKEVKGNLKELLTDFENRLKSTDPLLKPSSMDAKDFVEWQAQINRKAKGKDNYGLADKIWESVNNDLKSFDASEGSALLDAVSGAKLDAKTKFNYDFLSGLFQKSTTTGGSGQEIFKTGQFYDLVMNDANRKKLTQAFGADVYQNLKDYAETALKISQETGKRAISPIGQVFQGGMVAGGGAAAVMNPTLLVPYGAAPLAAWQIMKPRGVFKKWLTVGLNPEKTGTVLKIGGRAAISGKSEE